MIANPPKPIPRKINFKLHYYNKSPYCLFLYYAEGHPVNIKDRFIIGHMKIFNDTQMFARELYSTEHLNAALEWDNKYFYALLDGFRNFEIKAQQDIQDKSLDLIVRGEIEPGIRQLLLKATLQVEFGINIQKQFWKQFENYNNSKNQQIRQQEQLIKQNTLLSQQKLDLIKKACDEAEAEKKSLIGKLSAILMEKVNKLKEYEDDYNIEVLEDKFKKAKQQGEQRVMSTYQEDAEYGASLFQPSQQFR